MLPNNETIEFSERLNQALKRSLKQPLNAPELATQFNLRHPNEPITAQAAHKWLTGKAKPTSDKIETLAKWLEVPAYWLKYGNPQQNQSNVNLELRQNTSHEITVEELTPQAR